MKFQDGLRHGLAAIGLLAAASSVPAQGGAAQATIPAQTAITMVAPDVVRADFADLYAELKASHFDLYARVGKAEYDRLFARMSAQIVKPMTKDAVTAFFQRFVAFGRVAHARLEAADDAFTAYREAGARVFPLALRFRGDRAYIFANGGGVHSVAAGDEILAIQGRPIAYWLERAPRYVSADTPYMLKAMLEWEFPRIVWAELGDVPAFTLALRKPDGRRITVVLPARSRAEALAARAKLPAPLDLSWEKRDARMLPGRLAYLRPGPFYNVDGGADHMYDTTAFNAFIDHAFQTFGEAGATDLLIDLRNNGGGDNSFSDHMIAWFAGRPFKFNARFRIKVSAAAIASNQERLASGDNDPTGISALLASAYRGVRPGTVIDFPTPAGQPRPSPRFGGRVYALINRHSYSNTVTVAALLQDYGFGTVLGEETADLATTFGAMEHFTLRRTGLVVNFPKAMIVRPNGSMLARGVVPDSAIVTPAIEGPEDPVLREAQGLIGRRAAAPPRVPKAAGARKR